MRLMRQTHRQVNRSFSWIVGSGPHVARLAIDLLFPPLCIACGGRNADPHALCTSCWGAIAFIDAPFCARCGLPFDIDPGEGTVCAGCYSVPNEFGRARSLFRYDDSSKELLLPFKHADRLERAPALADWLKRCGSELLADAEIVLPVPLHRWRLWQRRYNQSALLAKRIAASTGKIFAPEMLERVRPTPSQGDMPTAKARQRNMLGAFRVPQALRGALKGKSVVLVDDVYTTGATLNACARALKRGGAATVDAITLARVVRPGGGAI